MNDFQLLIKEICDELNIKINTISKDWIIVLEKDSIKKFITGCHFDLDNHALGMIIDDKYATYELLKHINIPISHYEIVFNTDNKHDYAKECNTHKYVYKYFYKNKQNIVIKANKGSHGKNVFHITEESQIKPVLDHLLLSNYSISVSPYYEIKNEYRLVVLDNNIELIYKKIKPVVVGDGINTIKELLIKFNKHYFSNFNNLKEYDYDKILAKGEFFEYNWQFNLSGGAIASLNVDENVKKGLLDIVHKILNNINLNFASVDIIELASGDKMVLEINSGVCLDHFIQLTNDGRQIAKDIYKKAIMKMFNL